MREKYVTFKSVIRYENKCYFTAVEMNGLFILNEEDKTCQYVGSFPGEEPLQKDLYRGSAVCNGVVYFAPFYAKKIGCYNIRQNKTFSIDLPKEFKRELCMDVPKMLGVVSYGGAVFFFARSMPIVICIDVQTGKTSIILLENHPYDCIKKDFIFAVKYVKRGNRIYIPCYSRGSVVILSLERREAFEVQIKGQCGFNDIAYDMEKENFLLIAKNKAELLVWDGETSEVTKYTDPFFPNMGITFTEIVQETNILFLIGFKYKDCFTFDLDKKVFKKIEMKGIDINYREEGFYWCGKLSDTVWTFRKSTGELISLDGKHKICRVGCKNIKEMKLLHTKLKRKLYENRVFSLEDCLQCINKEPIKTEMKQPIGVGRKIYYSAKGVSI